MINANLIYLDQIIKIEQAVSIGRTDENSIIINDQSISRKHCIVRIENENMISIEDCGSSNGTILKNSNGDIEEIKGKVIFERLQEVYPDKILLGPGNDKYELEFHFPDLKTITIPPDDKANRLSIEKIKILTEICPNAGAVMVRRKLEEMLVKKLNDYGSIKNVEVLDLSQLIELASEKLIKLRPDDPKKMHTIRIAGNKGAHKENVSCKTVNDCINFFSDIEKLLG